MRRDRQMFPPHQLLLSALAKEAREARRLHLIYPRKEKKRDGRFGGKRSRDTSLLRDPRQLALFIRTPPSRRDARRVARAVRPRIQPAQMQPLRRLPDRIFDNTLGMLAHKIETYRISHVARTSLCLRNARSSNEV